MDIFQTHSPRGVTQDPIIVNRNTKLLIKKIKSKMREGVTERKSV